MLKLSPMWSFELLHFEATTNQTFLGHFWQSKKQYILAFVGMDPPYNLSLTVKIPTLRITLCQEIEPMNNEH